jgi:hypothetical protein
LIRDALQRVPWPGFWLGGFEGADHVNAAGQPLDLVRASGHLSRLDEDHRRARRAGLGAVRESIGWRLCEQADGTIDLSRALHVARSAQRHDLRVLWTLMHYGLPPSLNLHDDALIPRLARFAGAVARALRRQLGPGQVYTPVNEIGYLAWAASQSGLLAPPNGLPPGHEGNSLVCGYAVKRRLVRAALAAIDAILQEDPQARFLHCEPVVHVVPPPGRPDLAPEAEVVRSWQWQAWDLLAGRADPGLGGRPEALDIVGLNHYHSGQWELLTERRLHWHRRDPRRRPFGALVEEAHRRYGRPLVVAETGHVGIGRAEWLHDVASQAQSARARGVPLAGMGLYPLVDRPDWNTPGDWHRCGLWHVDTATGTRTPEPAVHDALRRWQAELSRPARRRGTLVALLSRRWDALPQIEQPALRELARHWHVVAVEPAVHDEPVPRIDARSLGPGLQVLVPHVPAGVRRLRDAAALLAPLLATHLTAPGPLGVHAWPVGDAARRLAPALAAGIGARPAVLPLPRGVIDLCAHRTAHGQRGTGWAAGEIARLSGATAGPRVGCLDVGDGARFDLDALAALADTLPALQFVLAGPAFADAPVLRLRRPNVRVLDTPPPALLPALLASWQAVLRPLLRPGQGAGLLLGLASGRPVVASGAAEARELAVATIAPAQGGTPALAAALRVALGETPAAARCRRRHARRLLQQHDAREVAAHWCRLLENVPPASAPRSAPAEALHAAL